MNTQNSPLLNHIHQFINTYQLIIPGQTIILGLSGGPDSMFLLHILAPLHAKGTINLIAAHLDHQWRTNSANDVEFCRSATEQLGIKLVTAKISELELLVKFNGSQEEMGRHARRIFFERIAQERCAERIALAHHYDDQQETFFIRLIRGASLAGLTGMKPQNNLYIRPLLHTKKSEILRYLEQNNIAYLTDQSNSSTNYLRNRIRHAVLPALRACDNRFDTTFDHTVTQLQDTERYLQKQTEELFTQIVSLKEGVLTINLNQFFSIDPYMQQRLLIHWLCAEQVPFTPTTPFLQEMLRFLQSAHGGSHALHQSWSVVKKQGLAYIQNHKYTI